MGFSAKFLKVVSVLYILIGLLLMFNYFSRHLITGSLGIYSIYLLLPFSVVIVFPSMIYLVGESFGNNICGQYHSMAWLCHLTQSGNAFTLPLPLVAVVLGVLGYMSVDWIKQGKKQGHMVWRGLILLALTFTVINFLTMGDNSTTAFEGRSAANKVFSFLSLFWTAVYFVAYLKLSRAYKLTNNVI